MKFAKVINMKTTITITSKGQTTLPVDMRRKLGLPQSGGVLHIDFNEHKHEVVISKPMTIEELSKQASSYIKPGTKPVLNVDEYYQKHRKPRV